MYYFIINPCSGSGRGRKVWNKVERYLLPRGAEYRVFLTERPGQATEFAQQLTRGSRDPRLIVVVGGDGTVNEVVDGICFGGAVTLGYIPVGVKGDLARSLKLSRSPLRNMKKILHPKYYKLVDYGVVTYGDEAVRHRRFMVSAGIGLNGAVCQSLLNVRSARLWRYLALKRLPNCLCETAQYVKARPAKGYILLDGEKRVEFNNIYQVAVQNHSFEGGGYRIAPGADCSDGRLEVCVLSNASKLQALGVLTRAWQKRSYNKGMRIYSCREARIHMERPMAVHVDGEWCSSQSDLEVRCIERALRMIV